MSIERETVFPGETATARQIIALADEYRRAADALVATGRRGQPLSRAPYRLTAIHAIELYLNAFLLAAGRSPAEVRGLHHNMALRTQLAVDAKLRLRAKTLTHLQALSANREYLASRYDPASSAASELNRLGATLCEVANKVSGFVSRTPG